MVVVREPTCERGFTLIELMIVVAIIALLAAVVVPTFTKQANKSKGKTEVTAMFTELAMKLETFKQEQNAYPTTIVKCPSSPAPGGYVWNDICGPTSALITWSALNIVPPEKSMRCAYTITTGAKGTVWTPPNSFKNSQGVVGAEPTPASSWWYLSAECDEDGAGGTAAAGTNAIYYE